MTFAEQSFREELAAMLFTFNVHFQKLGWVPLAVTGAVKFTSFLAWIKEDKKRTADFLTINVLDEEASAAVAQANVVAARELAEQYFNGLFRLYRDYDKAIETAYRAECRKNGAPQEGLALAREGT